MLFYVGSFSLKKLKAYETYSVYYEISIHPSVFLFVCIHFRAPLLPENC